MEQKFMRRPWSVCCERHRSILNLLSGTTGYQLRRTGKRFRLLGTCNIALLSTPCMAVIGSDFFSSTFSLILSIICVLRHRSY